MTNIHGFTSDATLRQPFLLFLTFVFQMPTLAAMGAQLVVICFVRATFSSVGTLCFLFGSVISCNNQSLFIRSGIVLCFIIPHAGAGGPCEHNLIHFSDPPGQKNWRHWLLRTSPLMRSGPTLNSTVMKTPQTPTLPVTAGRAGGEHPATRLQHS